MRPTVDNDDSRLVLDKPSTRQLLDVSPDHSPGTTTTTTTTPAPSLQSSTSRGTVAVVVPDAGTVDINDVNNILLEDGNFLTAVSVAPEEIELPIVTHMVKVTGFDSSDVPDEAELVSVEFRLKRKADVPGVAYTLVYMLIDGNPTTSFIIQPGYGETLAFETDEKTTSLPTIAKLKESDSGFGIVIEFYGGDGITPVTASIDYIERTINFIA